MRAGVVPAPHQTHWATSFPPSHHPPSTHEAVCLNKDTLDYQHLCGGGGGGGVYFAAPCLSTTESAV